ncbi:hypothetical protein [Sphingomonas quercus]|uniref:DUF202 domain-containing protein n=1 Tax=Sphingomonas quercus TaxID=2842451 RepID=A0ABS6BHR6_9SPHN|nr:hypothetical protein [Sphingomonas quercus]MBU3077843.1 hypothetical protein [Sphingomonas quercus]
MADLHRRSSPMVTVVAVIAILLALATIGWRATHIMGRIEGSGSAASSSFLAWCVVGLVIIGIGTAFFSIRRHRGAGEGNERAAWITIGVSIVVFVLALTATA